MLTLDTVTFNHDPSGKSKQSAFNLRKNATTLIELPEWVKDRPSQSPAAYTILKANERNIFVIASISRTSPTIQSARVRASERFVQDKGLDIGVHGPTSNGIPPALEWNPLGSLCEAVVVFNGNTAVCPLSIDGDRLARAGVGIGLVEWTWEYFDESRGDWSTFAETCHRVYCTLSDATEPWTLQPFASANAYMPWTDVLDYACRWAFRATSAPAAAAGCTRAVYGLGLDFLSFSHGMGSFTESGSGPSYFYCTAFLESLKLPDASRFNCSDAATVVSTFVNILGGNFLQVRFDRRKRPPDEIVLNPVLPIGHRFSWPKGATFGHHEAALDLSARIPLLFDACLVFDDSWRLLEAASLEVVAYLHRLVASNVADCGEVQRFRRPIVEPPNAKLAKQLEPLSQSIPGPLESAHWIAQRDEFKAALARWNTRDGFGLVLDLIAADAEWLKRYVEAFPRDLRNLEWRIPEAKDSLGDEAYESPLENCVVFRRGRLAVFGRRTFRTGEPVTKLARDFASALVDVVL